MNDANAGEAINPVAVLKQSKTCRGVCPSESLRGLVSETGWSGGSSVIIIFKTLACRPACSRTPLASYITCTSPADIAFVSYLPLQMTCRTAGQVIISQVVMTGIVCCTKTSVQYLKWRLKMDRGRMSASARGLEYGGTDFRSVQCI